MRGAGGLIILALIVLLVLNLPMNGQTLMQRIQAGRLEAAKYAASRQGQP